MKRFLPALLIAAFHLSAAPFLGQVRNRLLDSFGRDFLRVLGLLLAMVLVSVVGVGLWRIRSGRRWRYAALAAVVALVVLQTLAGGTGIAQVDLVEKVHFVQYGLLAAAIYWALSPRRDLSVLLLALLGTLAVGTLDELVQWWSPTRVGELKDIGLNVYAGLCGLLVAVAFMPLVPFRRGFDGCHGRQTARVAAVVLVLLAGFYQAAHVGYEIVDPEIGRFRSWFSPERLHELATERQVTWRGGAPLQTLASGEDRYRTEAGWHVSHRNASLAAGQVRTAWIENRILETYYDPFLDQEPSHGGGTHRWSPVQRAEVEARVVASGAPLDRAPGYDSPVLRTRIHPRPTSAEIWLGVVLVWAVLAVWEYRARRSLGPALARHTTGERAER
ncbi:MAG: VanZ family protein [Acidobacteria bacterium]|nr:VanZ family protein [Acidobacteriota bacterium]